MPIVPASAGLTGVTAAIVAGDLQITGAERADAISVRLRAGDSTVIEVMTGLTRAPEFIFRRSAVERISVVTAAGDDRVTIDDRFGAVGDARPSPSSSVTETTP